MTWQVSKGALGVSGVTSGLRRTDFPIGSVIVVQGYRAKNGKPIADGAKVTSANGRDFSLGFIRGIGTGPLVRPACVPRVRSWW